MPIDPVLSYEELALLPDALLIDARSGPDARNGYRDGHLPGASFADLESDLSGPKRDPAYGGRHPLPHPRVFAATVGDWGVTPNSQVVVYDDQNGANAAARLWWLLRALGHERVQVLDGGLAAALASGAQLSRDEPIRAKAPAYPADAWRWPVADIEHVEIARKRPEALVLDVRAEARYLGRAEPIDPVAGHIPGAENLPLTENLTASGRFKSAADLRSQYERVLRGRSPAQCIVHCGSGVTACHTLLALERAGLGGAALYPGSWSEWCRRPERERAP